MPTYIRKRIKILPWVTLNISKTGMSVSIGPKGAKLNIGKDGAYVNTSAKGTGVYNRTKISTSLLWAILVGGAIAGAGYFFGYMKNDMNLFYILCGAGILVGVLLFFLLRSIRKIVGNKEEETVIREEKEKKEGTTRSRSTKTANKTSTKTDSGTRTTTKKGTRTGGRSTTRTENASAKAYIDEVSTLLEKMADAKTLDELNKYHSQILDIMYSNLKPMGVKVLDMEFDDALATIEQEYAAGVKELTN